jgi:hypothetical protein
VSRGRLAGAGATVAALAIGFGIGTAQAADPRLDEAQQALQKAAALVEASQPGVVSEQAERRFERHRNRALDSIERASAQIDAAEDAVDNP